MASTHELAGLVLMVTPTSSTTLVGWGGEVVHVALVVLLLSGFFGCLGLTHLTVPGVAASSVEPPWRHDKVTRPRMTRERL